MDFNLTIVIACVIFVSFVSLLLINKFFRRKTFDEVIAEKKALADKIYGTNTKKQARATQHVRKEAKKDKKRQQKLLQQQQQQDSDGQQSETPSESAEIAAEIKSHIEFEPEPVAILQEEPSSTSTQTVLKQRKPKKSDKKQGVLVSNKTDNSTVAKESDSGNTNQLNHFDVKQSKDAHDLKKQPIKEVIVKDVKQQQNSSESPKSAPKKKADKKDKKEKEVSNILEADIQGVNGLMKLFSKADLNRSEIQVLIEFLLNKQQDMPESHSSWSDDIVPKLRKELEQAQNLLLEERSSTKSIQEKLHVLRNEYNAYRTKHSDFTRKFNENLEARDSEIADLKQEIVKLNEKFNVERQQLQTSTQLSRDKTQDLLLQIQNLVERENILKDEVANKNQIIADFEQTLKVANEKIQQLNDSLQMQAQQNNALEQSLEEAATKTLRLQEVEAEKESSKVEVRNLQNALDSTKSELALVGKKLEEASTESVKRASVGEEHVKKLKDELKEANDRIAQISTEKVQISKTMDDKYSKLENDNKALAQQQETYKQEIQKYKQIVSEKDTLINNFEMNSKQSEEIILKQVAEQKEKNNPAGKNSSDEQKLRQLFERICPEAVKIHANSALSSSFEQWMEQVLATHTELKSRNTTPASCSNGDVSNNTNRSNLSKSSRKANGGQTTEDFEKLTTENNKLKQEKSQLRAQNEELKKLVTNTENILNNLEAKAQEQDAKWNNVVKAKNEEIEHLKHSNGHQ